MQEKGKIRRNRRYLKRGIAFCLAVMLSLTGMGDFVTSKAANTSGTNIALASNGTQIFTDHPHDWAEGAGYGIEKMIDGAKSGSDTAMAQTDGQEGRVINLTLVFKRTYKAHSVALYKHTDGGFPVDFTVSACTKDGWKEVVKQENYSPQEGQNAFDFIEAVDCSAIRLTVTKNGVASGQNYQFYLNEIEVYGVESDTVIPEKFQIKNAAAAANGGTITCDRQLNNSEKVIDGDTNENNIGITGPNQEVAETNITVTFGEDKSWRIDTVRLYKAKGGGFPADFTIDVLSGDAWKTVRTVTGYAAKAGMNSFSFDEIDCKAVRLHVTKQTKDMSGGWDGYAIYLAELEAWGTVAPFNIALASNGTVASTSHPNAWAEGEAGYGIANVNDGLSGDGNKFFMTAMQPDYTGYQTEEMKVFLTFPKTYGVDTVRLYPGRDGGFPVDFEIRAYTASGWQTVAARTGYAATGGWNDFQFDPVDCSAVALVTSKNGQANDGNYGIQLSEIEVYGKDAQTEVSAPDLTEETDPARVRTNVALYTKGTTAATSHVNDWAEENNLGIANVNDGLSGDDQAFFMSAMQPEYTGYQKEEIKVFLKFAGTYQVDTVRLHTGKEGAFPKAFEIQAYTASGWKTVLTRTDYAVTAGWNEFQFDPVDCTAMALVTKENSQASDGQYGIHLSEFEVYGKKAQTTISIPDLTEETDPSRMRTNIALYTKGTTVATSHVNDWAEKEGYGAAAVNDGLCGDDNKFFMTAMQPGYQNEEMKVFLLFDGTYGIDTVRLHTGREGAFPVDFEIRAYTAAGWKTVASKTGYNATKGWNDFKFNPVDCSAIALVSTKNGRASDGNYGIHLSEFEVYGKLSQASVSRPDISEDTDPEMRRSNVALATKGTTAVTGHPNDWAEKEGYGVANVNDGLFGDDNKFFMTAMKPEYQDEEMKVFLLFQKTYQVDTVRLHTSKEGAFPVNFEIRAYTAGGWQTVAAQTGYSATKGWNEFKFAPVDCSAVALVTTENGQSSDGNYGIFLSEFEVYGKTAKTEVGAPDISKDTDPAMRRTNVALAANGTTASTSHVNDWGEKEGYGIANVNDGLFGDDNKFFMTAMQPGYQNEEMKVFLVFQETYQVDTVRLHTSKEGAFPVNFEIRAYTAGGWQTVVSQTGYDPQKGWNEFKFAPVDCRAVALVTTENGRSSDGNYGIFLSEFEVYGKKAETTVGVPDLSKDLDPGMRRINVALAANGTAASTSHVNDWAEKEGYGIANVNDGLSGNDNKFFMTAMQPGYQKEKMKVFLVFKETYRVDTIRLHTSKEGAFPVNFEIWAYTSEGWKTIISRTDYNAAEGWNEFKFDTVDCRAVALATTVNGQASDGNYGIFLSEFEVYGKKAETTVPAPDVSEYMNQGTQNAVAADNDDVSNVEKNIALYMPATSRTDFSIYGMGTEKLTDGDIYSMYSCDTTKAAPGTAEWVEINLLDNYMVNEVVLYARGKGWGFPIDFTISIFYDGDWKEVVNETGYQTTAEDIITAHSFKFPETLGNKIRIDATNMNIADGEYALQFMEVAAYGERAVGDYALPNSNIVSTNTLVTTATALEDYGYYKEYLVDSNVETGYSSELYDSSDHEEWIELDFRRPMKVSEVQLKPAWGGYGFPEDFSIQVWEEETEDWVTALTVEDCKKPIDVAWQKFVLDHQYLSQKIRIVTSKLGQDFGQYSLKSNEIEAYLFPTDEEVRGAMEVVNSVRTEYAQTEVLSAAPKSNKMAKMAFAFGIGMFALAAAGGLGAGAFLIVRRVKRRRITGTP